MENRGFSQNLESKGQHLSGDLKKINNGDMGNSARVLKSPEWG